MAKEKILEEITNSKDLPKKVICGAGEIAQQFRVLAALVKITSCFSKDIGSIPSTPW